MSQSSDDAFGYSVTKGKHNPQWWENEDSFLPTSVPRASKIPERHDLEADPQKQDQSQQELFNNSLRAKAKSGQLKTKAKNKKSEPVNSLQSVLKKERWLAKNGHTLSYAGLFLFTFILYFRPYELIPTLSSLSSMALISALLTLVVFFPTQLTLEGNLTARPVEVTCVLVITLCGLVTIPLAQDSSWAWETFNDVFIKAVLMFIVMVNVLRTETRLKGMIWLSLGVGIWLGLNALEDYRAGNFAIEGYRVEGSIGGMFGNPNDMALHLVTMTPLAVALFLSADNLLKRAVYGFCIFILVAGNTVTFSRGGFLGLMVSMGIMMWKVSRNNRVLVIGLGTLFLLAFIVLAPGNYGLRILSIFIPGLDGVGSSNQRKDLLMQSLLVTLRNPWGIGMGNFNIISSRNLVTHNAYTQVSTEMGVIAFAAYIMFMVKPLRRLREIEKETFGLPESSKYHYLAIGLQASLIGYMAGSFFVSVAYQWFVYYIVAYAIGLRRIYSLAQEEQNKKLANSETNTTSVKTEKLVEAV